MGLEGSGGKKVLGQLEENVHIEGIGRHGLSQSPSLQPSNVSKASMVYLDKPNILGCTNIQGKVFSLQ